MGAAALWACARRGWNTLGIEQFPLVHDRGSSHGHSRIIREAYYEHPSYVPLVRQAFDRWREIEQLAHKPLLTRCDCANIGRPDSDIVRGVELAAATHQLPVESWNAGRLKASIPALTVPDDFVAIIENNAGWLKVEDCVRSMLTLAVQNQATIVSEEKVINWQSNPTHIEVQTGQSTYRADRLIITAGPWASKMISDLRLPLHIMRQIQWWFTPPAESAETFTKRHLPIFMVEADEGHFYGIPSEAGPGVKIAQHYGEPELTSPEEIDRTVTEQDLSSIRSFLSLYIPRLADAPVAQHAVCMYTLSPDRHFVIDKHPHHDRVAIACGFSGHGFKFAPVVGEMLAGLSERRQPDSSQNLFKISRLLT